MGGPTDLIWRYSWVGPFLLCGTLYGWAHAKIYMFCYGWAYHGRLTYPLGRAHSHTTVAQKCESTLNLT
jgi:hypothetical protein